MTRTVATRNDHIQCCRQYQCSIQPHDWLHHLRSCHPPRLGHLAQMASFGLAMLELLNYVIWASLIKMPKVAMSAAHKITTVKTSPEHTGHLISQTSTQSSLVYINVTDSKHDTLGWCRTFTGRCLSHTYSTDGNGVSDNTSFCVFQWWRYFWWYLPCYDHLISRHSLYLGCWLLSPFQLRSRHIIWNSVSWHWIDVSMPIERHVWFSLCLSNIFLARPQNFPMLRSWPIQFWAISFAWF